MEPPLDYSALRKPSNKKGKELENSKSTPSNLDFANLKVNLNYSFKESANKLACFEQFNLQIA